MGTLGYVRMVLWSFFGIRRGDAAGDEQSKARPVLLVAVAIILAGLFGLTVWGTAKVAVLWLAGWEPALPRESVQQSVQWT